MKTTDHMIQFRLLSLLLVAIMLAVPTMVALAETIIYSANGNEWDVEDITGDDDGSIDDGSDDAFDGYGMISLHVEDGIGSNLGTDIVLDGFGLTWDSGRRFATTTPVTLGDIRVHRDLYAPAASDYMRYIDTFTNTSGAVRRVWTAWGGNLGSDSWTTIAATSSGDLNIPTV
jgi:hypothetical protein